MLRKLIVKIELFLNAKGRPVTLYRRLTEKEKERKIEGASKSKNDVWLEYASVMPCYAGDPTDDIVSV